MKKKFSEKNIRTFVIAAVILIIALLAFSLFKPVNAKTVSVSGTSTVNAEPDLISVVFNIETTGATSVEASDKNNAIYNELIENLKAFDLGEDNLTTEGLNIYQNYEWINNQRVDKGFKANHQLKLELGIEEKEKINQAIDAAILSGALINYINFELTTESQNMYKAQAIELAAKDASTKAEAVANGFGKNVGRLTSVQVDNFGYFPWVAYSARADLAVAESGEEARIAATNINPGEREITASVTATYKLR